MTEFMTGVLLIKADSVNVFSEAFARKVNLSSKLILVRNIKKI